jgi:hypothetical protein
MYWYWATIIAIGILNRLLPCITNIARARYKPDMEQNLPSSHTVKASHIDNVIFFIQRHFILPETFGSYNSRSLLFTIPHRIQSLTILAFIIINVVLCAVNYRLFTGNL